MALICSHSIMELAQHIYEVVVECTGVECTGVEGAMVEGAVVEGAMVDRAVVVW